MDAEARRRELERTRDQVLELFDKQALVSELTARQGLPRNELLQQLLHRQQLVELQRRILRLHPADVAYLIESLPPDRRGDIWGLLEANQQGAVLLELSDAVRESVVCNLDDHALMDAAEHLETDEIADLLPSLPQDTVTRLLARMDSEDRHEVQTALSFPEGTVGSLMEFDVVRVRQDVTLEVVLRYLRSLKSLPPGGHDLLVVDRAGILKGQLPLERLVLNNPEQLVSEVMNPEPRMLYLDESARDAVEAFERYDLLAAPVTNRHGLLVGVLRVGTVVDHLKESAQLESLKAVGLREDEDLFASVWESGRNRWAWLALNLCTAFISSRAIGLFESSIAQLVALAALMPIVASVAGNTGNQTSALVIRGLALKQIGSSNFWRLLSKEIRIAMLNGVIWGSVIAAFAAIIYQDLGLAGVMAIAVIINLLLASIIGVLVPFTLHRLGRDPVLGSSVMLTAVTDTAGFCIFLGLATALLL
jgi:magnesium transporter